MFLIYFLMALILQDAASWDAPVNAQMTFADVGTASSDVPASVEDVGKLIFFFIIFNHFCNNT